MSRWLARCATLLLIAGCLAAADSAIRPLKRTQPPRTTTTESTPGQASQTTPAPAADSSSHSYEHHDLQWLVGHFENQTANIVDARTLDEYRAGHIPGAWSLPFAAFFSGVPELLNILDPGMKIVLYCGGGDCDASHKVRELLLNYGYTDVDIFVPGFPAWSEAGQPVEAGDPAF